MAASPLQGGSIPVVSSARRPPNHPSRGRGHAARTRTSRRTPTQATVTASLASDSRDGTAGSRRAACASLMVVGAVVFGGALKPTMASEDELSPVECANDLGCVQSRNLSLV